MYTCLLTVPTKKELIHYEQKFKKIKNRLEIV